MPTIMLDVDGVLVTGRPQDGAHLFTDLEKDLGINVELLQRAFFKLHWPAIVTGQKPLLPVLTEVLAKVAPTVTAERLIAYWFLNDSRLDLVVLEAVAKLRAAGARVYLATNQEHMRAHYLMTNLGLKDRVDGMCYSASFGYRKPSREFFAKATEAVAVAPEAIVLIDDTEANVLAARAFGWKAVHWKPGMAVATELSAIAL